MNIIGKTKNYNIFERIDKQVAPKETKYRPPDLA